MSKYNEVMEHIAVSDEMKERIIGNVQSADLNESKIVRFPNMKRYLALVACLAIVLVCAFAVHQMNKEPRVVNPPLDTAGVETAWGTVEYKSAKALSKVSGIEIEDLNNLPFTPTETSYQDYKDNLVEINYSDGERSLYYRVSKGSTDNSGDYNEYENVYTKEINGASVTFKGNGDLIHLALYEKSGCSYTIGAPEGLTEQQFEKMIQ